jgi:hypothetical protein
MNQQNIANRCLLCKRLRTNCNINNCEFGMYFPANRNDDLKCALEVYGLSNIIKYMRSVEPYQRQTTANSLLFEGYAWRVYPTNGLFGYNSFMNEQTNLSLRELQIANSLLKFCKDHVNSNSERVRYLDAFNQFFLYRINLGHVCFGFFLKIDFIVLHNFV